MYAVRTYDAPWIIYDWRGEKLYATKQAAIKEAMEIVKSERERSGRPLYQDGSFHRDLSATLRLHKGSINFWTRIYIVER